MTLYELIYDLRTTINAGKLSDDSELENEQVKFWIRTQRAYLIRQEANKGRQLDRSLIQDLGCLTTEIVDRAECCEYPINCIIMRTVDEVPIPIEANNRILVTRVGPIDKLDRGFSIVTPQQAVFSGNGRFNKNEMFAFYKDRRWYIKINEDMLSQFALEKINVQQVCEDPEAAGSFRRCDGTPCYTPDDQYPLPMWMSDYMKAQIINSNYKIWFGTPIDSTNDAGSSVQQNAQTLQPTNNR